jgi:DNA-directed RNA polymerase subunit RPC12/RpoP
MKNSEKKMTVDKALEILENAQGKDFYTIEYHDALDIALDALREKANPAHWVFSGDIEDYDGYYMNCSTCGTQRKAYDRNYDLDVPVACPHCGTRMDLNAHQFDIDRNYEVSVIYNTDNVKRPFILHVAARNEDQAKVKALGEVAMMLNADAKIRSNMYVDYVSLMKGED